ncbi:hypothetical protein PQU95_01475 [Vogesella sp. DC21W]|uniref:Uncharacterized protein n=1 Tax=Vogesella aquatica TaxID=2984206 RepID=A0ABT5IUN0_9NEIS|nr:hypothetical protein [Vogesella aquatica]MDC7715893.1 hypothetical protein [Vogesella aquatica]
MTKPPIYPQSLHHKTGVAGTAVQSKQSIEAKKKKVLIHNRIATSSALINLITGQSRKYV